MRLSNGRYSTNVETKVLKQNYVSVCSFQNLLILHWKAEAKQKSLIAAQVMSKQHGLI